MRRAGAIGIVLLAALFASGCGGDDGVEPRAQAAPRAVSCPSAWEAGWQRLADRIDARVYCPAWMPDPLTGELGGRWNNIEAVDPDGSYLMGFTWYEQASGEIHVNLRGHPGSTEIPDCDGQPCFSDPRGTKRVGAREITVYTANRGADRWHVLYAWEEDGSLYTLSEHIAEPLTYERVVANLDRMLRHLVAVDPRGT